MKIFFYTNNINPAFGGSVFSLQLLVAELSKLGIEVKVIINRHHETEIDLMVPVIALDAKFGDLQRPFQLRNLVKKEKPDAIFASMKPMMITLGIARLISPGSKTRFIGIERMSDHGLFYLGKWRYLPKRLFIRFFYGLLDHIVAISQFVKKDLSETYWLPSKKISVIYNAVDLNLIRNKAKESLPVEHEELFQSHQIMLNIGRLTTQKAQYHLINILSILKDDLPNLHLVILGEGNLKDALEEQAKKSNLANRVHFLGHCANPFTYIAKADVFALTSIHEAFGRVVLESMAIGSPVIAFDARGGHVELLANGAGIIIPKGDEETFAAEVNMILNDDVKRSKIIETAFERSNEFSSEKHAQSYINCVEKIK